MRCLIISYRISNLFVNFCICNAEMRKHGKYHTKYDVFFFLLLFFLPNSIFDFFLSSLIQMCTRIVFLINTSEKPKQIFGEKLTPYHTCPKI